jgi:hypothetical protein
MRFVKNPADRPAMIAAGEAIIKVSESVFKTGPGVTKTAWQVFEEDPAAWLHNHGYRLVGPGAPADGTIPPNLLRIVPVYDTANTMHVRVPWIGNIDRTVAPPDGAEYRGSFPAFLASYFTRRCR